MAHLIDHAEIGSICYPPAEAHTSGVRRLRRGIDSLRQWRKRAMERRRLASLEDRALGDLGLRDTDVGRAASQAFWYM